MYKEPKQGYGNTKPQPKPDWTDILTDKSNKMYDTNKPPRAKESKAGAGYLGSGTDSKNFGM
jgi:hypothetical protein